MRIKKLILHGFKSFADKTEFEFRDGITVIVGPNGCGKSNVVDAVKWVLGEQRPTSLRGKEMQDVIFSGTDARKGVGFAEVALVLDNTEGTLPIDYSEVVVTRRLYKSGESEYLLNGNRVRLRDVRELMMDSGGGPGGMTVMEQGNIDRLLRADPRERRRVFEEAAGIAKYRARRKETERKLERTAENLARLLDILSEYETRQRSLKIQAGKARRWRELTETLKRKRVAGALARFRDLQRQRDAAQGALDGVEGQERAARAALEQAVSSTEERRAELDAARQRVGNGEAELAALMGERRADEEKRAALERETRELAERAEQAEQASAAARKREEQHYAELRQAREELEQAAEQSAQRTEALEAAEALLEKAEGRVGVLRDERDALDGRRTEAFRVETKARNDEIACGAELKALRSRIARLDERGDAMGTELQTLTATREKAELELRGSEETLRSLEDRDAAAEEGARGARAESEEAAASSARLAEEAAAVEARRDLLRGLVREGEGLSKGTRALLEAGDALEGVRGTLAERVGDAKEHAAALDQALGALAGAVVVDTTAQALAAIEWLAAGDRGRARLIPLDRVGEAEPPPRFADVLDPEVGRLVGALLEGTRIVATVEEALEEPGRAIVLTGEELEASGAIVGGAGDAGAGLVLRQAELADAEARLAGIAEERARAETRLVEARRKSGDWERTLAEIRPRLKAAREAQREAREALAAAEQASAARHSEVELETAERADVERAIAEAEERREAVQARLGRAQEESEELEEESRGLADRLARAAREREEAAARCTEAKVELARWTEKAEAGGLRARAVEEAIASADREARARGEEAATCRERRTRCFDDIEALAVLAAERGRSIDALSKRVEDERRSVREMEENLEAGGSRVRELRDAHERRREELERHRLQENELRLRIETLLEQVRRDHGLELSDAEAGEDEAADPAQLEAEIEELRTKVERLGNVNHAALEELGEVEGKIEFMRREKADLEAADRQLRETIDRIDSVCTARFSETFDQVKEHFHVIFRKLFGGGKAELFLEDPEDLLGSGIDIRVRPPGKELRNMALLSGGERSLTTVALLFSIYQTRPPPFCLLDEVDAALDEANTVRMCEMLKELARDGQFLIITHARPTMTVADRLYGVTMPEAGVSRRVSVQFADIEAGRVVGLN